MSVELERIVCNLNEPIKHPSIEITCRIDMMNEVMLEESLSYKRDDSLKRGW